MTTILHTFTNADDGVAAEVAQISSGFSVVIRDLDADAVAPVAKIFKAEDAAVTYAKTLV